MRCRNASAKSSSPAYCAGQGIVLLMSGQAHPVLTPARETRPLRTRMVMRHLAGRGIRDQRVLAAMRWAPREWFLPPHLAGNAYSDAPLPIGSGQTISQPYVVALMTERLDPKRRHRILEIGTGSGYQTAILAYLAGNGK